MKDSNVIDRLENLKNIREERNVTQIKLAVDLGVSQELISRYELGYSFPQPNMLIRLADYFNCSIDYLLGRTDITTPIKILASTKDTIEYSRIIEKYEVLSNSAKKQLLDYIDYLLIKDKD